MLSKFILLAAKLLSAIMAIQVAIFAFTPKIPLISTLPPALIAVALWWWSGSEKRRIKRENEVNEKLVNETVAFFEKVNTTRSFPEPQTSRIISSPDNPIIAACNANLFELITTRSTNYVGTRVNLGGIPISIGQSSPITKTELKESSQGELAITPNKLIFSGPKKSTDIALSRITSIDLLRDGITLTMTGRQKPITLQVPNSILWAQLIKNIIHIKPDGRNLPAGTTMQAR